MSRNSVSIAQAARLWSERNEYYELLYGRGPLVVRMLHTTIGDDAFWELLPNLLKKYAHKTISTQQFAEETSAAAGRDMRWFFTQWIESPGIPDLDVTKSVSKKGGVTSVTGHLKQHDAARFKVLVLPVVYESKGARAVSFVTMDKAEQDFRVDLPADASKVEIDPDRTNLVYYH